LTQSQSYLNKNLGNMGLLSSARECGCCFMKRTIWFLVCDVHFKMNSAPKKIVVGANLALSLQFDEDNVVVSLILSLDLSITVLEFFSSLFVWMILVVLFFCLTFLFFWLWLTMLVAVLVAVMLFFKEDLFLVLFLALLSSDLVSIFKLWFLRSILSFGNCFSSSL